MIHQGILRKMRTVQSDPVQYFLPFGDVELPVNDLIGKNLSIKYLNEINCIRCGRKTSKSFAQGFCYPCFISAPETEECVLHPELCRAHEGIARDMEYAKNHCLIEQIVYLSLTSGLKVGVTRSTQVPTRWIDQGAVEAIILAITPNRFTAGQIEVFLKAHMKDKTNWRAMLKGQIDQRVSLLESKKQTLEIMPESWSEYYAVNNEITRINYPLNNFPVKVTSINLEKEISFTGTLSGIKGQYLIFEDGRVINIRKYGGYLVQIDC